MIKNAPYGGRIMSDGGDAVDIRVLALRRQQRRSQSRATVDNLIDTEAPSPYGRIRSGRSSYEPQSAKSYMPEVRSSTRKSYLSNMPVPIFEDDSRIGRMHVPPVVKCECNGIETYALINSAETVSTMSMDLIRRMRLTDQIIPEASHIYNPLALNQQDIKGKVKYIDLGLGSWQQVAQFNVVETSVADITLGIDFLRKTQSVVNFEDSSLLVGGTRGERVPFLNTRDIMGLTRKSANRQNYSLL